MSLNRLFDTIEKARGTAHWQAAFGEPQAAEGKVVIPVAQVGYGFGLGFGRGVSPGDTEDESSQEGEGGGGGGGAMARPLGAVVVTPEEAYFEGFMDTGKIALAGLCVGALTVFQLAKTLRAIFGRE